MASLVTEQTEAKKQEDIYNKINEVLTSGNFMIAKAAYEKCLEDCKDTEDYRKYAAGPPKKVMIMNPRRRREKNRARMASYKKAKMNYENCKQRCHKDWYMAIVGLIGQGNKDLNEDVLVKINEMLQEKEQKEAKEKKKGGRKTRRKKGTKRKRKKSRRRRKSKRRN
tara:strand:+ start:206 stop:706 length:501 start_codon:yes stop_codon:yes gene_type:complete